ncbi:MAG TPA: hypothetical protein VNO70_01860, partial [Blastocatellia bacterium]|nr:hypothetical protein [Blastocatellia bacterium]
MKKFLLDEHIPLAYRPQMIRQAQAIQPESDLIVWAIGDPGAPGKGTLDLDLLRWCEAQGFALVANNRRS